MKNRIIQIARQSVLLLVLLSSQFVTIAGEVVVEGMNADLTTDLLVLSDRHTEVDIDPIWDTHFGIAAVRNKITFGIDQSILQIDPIYEYKVVFDLAWEKIVGTSLVMNNLTDLELKLNFDPDGSYQDQELYTFEGGMSMNLTNIRLYKWDGASFVLTTLDRDNLFLKGEITTESYDDFAYNLVPVNLPTLSLDGSDVLVNWTSMHAAEAYDLEWAWVNAYDGETVAGEATLIPETGLMYDFK
ncbi:MAG: hypothetical protein JKY48_10125, partial [Flavobacteriales bacterium]|nr:hypothetical protein [Flavobacteriales bacterium]